MTNNLNIAIEASVKAGAIIMDIYKNQEFGVMLKGDDSPVTIADKKANDCILEYLKTTSIPIISEESIKLDYKTRKNWKQCWIVDPLDGTKEFIKRNGEFTVNIALVENGIPVMGVIYVPEKKALYYANVADKVSYKVVLNKHETAIDEIFQNTIKIFPSNSENIVKLVSSRSHKNQNIHNLVTKLEQEGNEVELIVVGSSLKFCMLAEGSATHYPRYAPTMEWDTAAGQAICNAVGIKVISHETNKELTYNNENLKNPWFTAGITRGNLEIEVL